MKSIIQITNSFQAFGMFVQLTDDGARYVLNPTHATEFSNIEQAKQWIDVNIANPKHYKVLSGKACDTLYAEFLEYLDNGMPGRDIELIDQSHNEMFDEDVHSFKDVLDWLWWYTIEAKDGAVSFKVYKSWQDAKSKFSSIFWEFEQYDNEDHTESFYGMEIMVSLNTAFESFKNELNMLLDNYQLTHKVKVNGNKKEYSGIAIKLFTDDLSSSGVLHLVMVDRENDQWAVGKITYGHMREMIAPTSLKDCFDKMIIQGYTYE